MWRWEQTKELPEAHMSACLENVLMNTCLKQDVRGPIPSVVSLTSLYGMVNTYLHSYTLTHKQTHFLPQFPYPTQKHTYIHTHTHIYRNTQIK